MLKVGIIGCGGFGNLHSQVIQNLGVFTIRAYADVDENAARVCCDTYGAAYYDTDYTTLICDPEIDVIFCCSTHDVHYPVAMACIERGKHVFMEKPLSMTGRQCQEIERALSKTRLKFAVGHKMRFAPHVQRAKREIPKPITIAAQMMCNRWADDIWAQDPVKGGGNVLSQGCHIFDLITFLAGAPPQSLYAEGGEITHPGSGIIDNITATVRFQNGVIAGVCIGDAGLNEFTSKTMVQIYGGDDCVNLSDRLYSYARYNASGTEVCRLDRDHFDIDSDPEGFYAEVRAFYECVVNGGEPPVGVKEGKNAVLMVEAAFRAVREGTVQSFV